MIGFWWHKPLNVQHPIVANLESELAAEIYYCTPRIDLYIEEAFPGVPVLAQ